MKNKIQLVVILLISILIGSGIQAQTKTENIVLVTIDGLRWQEMFGGADSTLLKDNKYTKNFEGTSSAFWHKNLDERRKMLFPFIWNTVAKNGQIHGNRNAGSKVNVANPYQFSYPGYNEILTGFPDPAVNSNDKIYNKNTNVLAFINQQKNFKGKVAVFSTWNAFPYIVNEPASGVYVNADVDTLKFDNPSLKLLNDMQFLTPRPVDVRPDVITYMAAREYFKAYRPRVLYIAFDETDDLAHGGEYDQYLKSAHAEDAMLADIWKLIQSDPEYKNKTTLLITCDHGRGDLVKDTWRDHGEKIAESGETWIAAIGPDTPVLGEVKTTEQLYQKQYAATIAALLGLKFTADHPVAEPIREIYTKE
ncbi:MAG: alkaline phosphatase family protein [Prolixibacteraceae bacterium]